jgi:transcriptional regulator with XRE-family HTH domain
MNMAPGRGEAAVEHLEEELGRQVRALRRSRGLTQQQVADLANTSVGALKHLESGQGATTRTLVRVLRALEAESWLSTLFVPRATFNPLDLPGLRAP